jgi:phosphopantetheine--protein transferase-like protein
VDAGSSNITQQQQQQQISVSTATSKIILPLEIEKWLDVTLPEGRCVGVHAIAGDDAFPVCRGDDEDDDDTLLDLPDDHWMRTCFHPDEIQYGATLKQSRTSFWLGRLALRMALDFPDYPILRDSFGRPQLLRRKKDDDQHDDNSHNAEVMMGSISHKQHRGVALVSSSCRNKLSPLSTNLLLAGVGVDLEMTSRPEGKPSIAKRVLTPSEQDSLGNLPGLSDNEEVLLRFSLKEAIYKAAHPLLCQYVGFQEAEVTPLADGTATCRWMLSNQADRRIAKLTAHWYRLPMMKNEKTTTITGIDHDDDGSTNCNEDFFLTTASVYTNQQS